MSEEPAPTARAAHETSWALTAESIDELFENALRSQGSHAFVQQIDQICALSRYALWNAFLISVQRPGAVAVASAREWREQCGRMIIPGARPIVILQTFGPVRFVYDVEDTTGPDLPGRPTDLFQVVIRGPRQVNEAGLKALSDAVENKDAVLVRRDDFGTNLAGQAVVLHATEGGRTVGSSKNGIAFVVSLARRLGPAEALATLAHELAHIYCGHLGRPTLINPKTKKPSPMSWSDRRGRLTVPQQEFEAEATAYLVCRRLGLETRSADYLAGYLSETDRTYVSYATIIRAASRIEGLMPRSLAPVATTHAEAGASQTELFPALSGWSVRVE
jgi:hypothetical protein